MATTAKQYVQYFTIFLEIALLATVLVSLYYDWFTYTPVPHWVWGLGFGLGCATIVGKIACSVM